jgi:hypothetical protein
VTALGFSLSQVLSGAPFAQRFATIREHNVTLCIVSVMPPTAQHEALHRIFQRDEESAANLAEFTETGLGDTAGRQIWRALMATRTYPFVSQMRLQAQAETLADGILAVFDERGIEVDEAARARIESCHDAEALKVWLRRSAVVASASELFD